MVSLPLLQAPSSASPLRQRQQHQRQQRTATPRRRCPCRPRGRAVAGHAHSGLSGAAAAAAGPIMAPAGHASGASGASGGVAVAGGGGSGGALESLAQAATNTARSAEFFARVATIYGAYKATQLRAALMRLGGADDARVKAELWDGQHAWAGGQMYDLCISLRGFYLKAGQFIGARADFVPEQICSRLSLLQDRVPPMAPERTRRVVTRELGVADLGEVFEWIELDAPVGSASISQVHRAKLRRFPEAQLRALRRHGRGLLEEVRLGAGDSAWSVCNARGVSLAELGAANPGVDLDALREGDVARVPVVLGLQHFGGGGGASSSSSISSSSSTSSSSSGGAGWRGLGRLFGGGDGGRGGGGAAVASAAVGGDSTGSSNGQQALPAATSGSSSTGGGGGGGGGGRCRSESGSESETDDWLEPSSSVLRGVRSTSSGGDSSGGSSGGRHLLELVTARGEGRGRRGRASSGGGSSDGSSGDDLPLPDIRSPAAAAVAHAAAAGHSGGGDGGLVAVKVQYPGALQTMTLDLVNLRSVSAFLQKTELRFDLLSAVEELQRQIHLEFDFMREARVMDTIAEHLRPLASRVAVPRSVPGLVRGRLMVMTFLEGTPLTQLRDKVAHLPQWQRDKAARRILARVSEAYGRMILGEGLFQADGHPGNILVQRGGRVALLDYGQSKQLGREDKRAFAELVLALQRGDKQAISDALWALNVATSKDDPALRAEMAYGMFDTRGRVDPFDKASPIKQAAIEKFPPDMFFVLRVVQLLRGMANGMGIEDFSTAQQWAPLARAALDRAKREDQQRGRQRTLRRRLTAQPLLDLAAVASPMRLTV